LIVFDFLQKAVRVSSMLRRLVFLACAVLLAASCSAEEASELPDFSKMRVKELQARALRCCCAVGLC
jgi:hypothetical protein